MNLDVKGGNTLSKGPVVTPSEPKRASSGKVKDITIPPKTGDLFANPPKRPLAEKPISRGEQKASLPTAEARKPLLVAQKAASPTLQKPFKNSAMETSIAQLSTIGKMPIGPKVVQEYLAGSTYKNSVHAIRDVLRREGMTDMDRALYTANAIERLLTPNSTDSKRLE